MATVIILDAEVAEKLITATLGPNNYLDPRPIDIGPDAGKYVLSPECASNPVYADFFADMATTVNLDPDASFSGALIPDPWDDVKVDLAIAASEGRLEEVRAEKLEAIDVAIAADAEALPADIVKGNG